MSTHARLSPSSADRWMLCPGSVVLEDGLPDTSNDNSDSGTATQPFLDAINKAVRLDGYHGLGDDMLALALPEKPITITGEVLTVAHLSKEVRAGLIDDVAQYIRCVFRENQAYRDTLLTWPLALFSFSTLNQEIRNQFPQIESLYFAERDFKTGLEIARLAQLTLSDLREGT